MWCVRDWAIAYGNFMRLTKMNRLKMTELAASLGRHRCCCRFSFVFRVGIWMNLIKSSATHLYDCDAWWESARTVFSSSKGETDCNDEFLMGFVFFFSRRCIQRDWYGFDPRLLATQSSWDTNENIHHSHNGLHDCAVAGECGLVVRIAQTSKNIKRNKKCWRSSCVFFPHS